MLIADGDAAVVLLRGALAGKKFEDLDYDESYRDSWDAIVADLRDLPDDAQVEIPAEFEV